CRCGWPWGGNPRARARFPKKARGGGCRSTRRPHADQALIVALRKPAELLNHLDIRVEVREHDHLADFGVLIATATSTGEAAPPACTAAAAEADVGLAGIAFADDFL